MGGLFQRELDEDVATGNVHDLVKSFEVENIVKCATFSAAASLERRESRWGTRTSAWIFPIRTTRTGSAMSMCKKARTKQ
jgi:succinate dehydrogenase/fumarate reductase flavoprotein subunit